MADNDALSAAIRIGERHHDQVIKYTMQVRIMRREMQDALALLKIGKPHEARTILEKALSENR